MRQFIMSEINDAWILAAQREVNNQLSIWSEQAQSTDKGYIIWPKVFLGNKAAKPVPSSAHIAPLS